MQRNKLVLIYFSFIETGLANYNDSSDISGRCALHIQFAVHINQGRFWEQARVEMVPQRGGPCRGSSVFIGCGETMATEDLL